MTGDLHWNNVVLLANFDDNTFNDVTGRHGVVNSADVATATVGGFSGFGPYLSNEGNTGIQYVGYTGNNDDWNFGTEPFTIEFSFFSTGSGGRILSSWNSGANAAVFTINFGIVPTSFSVFVGTVGGTSFAQLFGGTVSIVGGFNTWRRYCFERDAVGDFRIYSEGVLLATDTTQRALSLTTVNDGGSAPNLGVYQRAPFTETGSNASGRVDEIRITKGVARYQGAYTVSGAPFPTNGLESVVIPRGTGADFDTRIREIGNVLHDPDDVGQEYKLVYSGYTGAYAGNNVYIGWAHSTDGVTWTKGGKLTLGADRASEDPYLVKSGSTYYLYVEDKEDVPFRDIRVYTSTDFSTWTDAGEALAPGTGWEATDVSSPVVWIEGATWYMLYEGRGSSQPGAVGLATSTNGTTWTKSGSNPVLVGTNATYSYAGVTWGNAIVPHDIKKDFNTYILLFNGAKPTDAFSFKPGIATSTNLTTWSDHLGRPRDAVVGVDGTQMYAVQDGEFMQVYPGEGIRRFPSPTAGDANWTDVTLYISGFGYDGENRPVDCSRTWAVITPLGDAQFDDTSSDLPESGASMLFDGTGDFFEMPDNTAHEFGSGAFTVEFWALVEKTSQQFFIAKTEGTTSDEDWYIDYNGTNLRFVGRPNSTDFIVCQGAWSPSINTWYHIAADRNGNDWRVYVDGAVIGTLTDSRTIRGTACVLRIGGRKHPSTTLPLDGRMQGIRITKGVARYNGAFTAPTALYPIGEAEPAFPAGTPPAAISRRRPLFIMS